MNSALMLHTEEEEEASHALTSSELAPLSPKSKSAYLSDSARPSTSPAMTRTPTSPLRRLLYAAPAASSSRLGPLAAQRQHHHSMAGSGFSEDGREDRRTKGQRVDLCVNIAPNSSVQVARASEEQESTTYSASATLPQTPTVTTAATAAAGAQLPLEGSLYSPKSATEHPDEITSNSASALVMSLSVLHQEQKPPQMGRFMRFSTDSESQALEDSSVDATPSTMTLSSVMPPLSRKLSVTQSYVPPFLHPFQTKPPESATASTVIAAAPRDVPAVSYRNSDSIASGGSMLSLLSGKPETGGTFPMTAATAAVGGSAVPVIIPKPPATPQQQLATQRTALPIAMLRLDGSTLLPDEDVFPAPSTTRPRRRSRIGGLNHHSHPLTAEEMFTSESLPTISLNDRGSTETASAACGAASAVSHDLKDSFSSDAEVVGDDVRYTALRSSEFTASGKEKQERKEEGNDSETESQSVTVEATENDAPQAAQVPAESDVVVHLGTAEASEPVLVVTEQQQHHTSLLSPLSTYPRHYVSPERMQLSHSSSDLATALPLVRATTHQFSDSSMERATSPDEGDSAVRREMYVYPQLPSSHCSGGSGEYRLPELMGGNQLSFPTIIQSPSLSMSTSVPMSNSLQCDSCGDSRRRQSLLHMQHTLSTHHMNASSSGDAQWTLEQQEAGIHSFAMGSHSLVSQASMSILAAAISAKYSQQQQNFSSVPEVVESPLGDSGSMLGSQQQHRGRAQELKDGRSTAVVNCGENVRRVSEGELTPAERALNASVTQRTLKQRGSQLGYHTESTSETQITAMAPAHHQADAMQRYVAFCNELDSDSDDTDWNDDCEEGVAIPLSAKTVRSSSNNNSNNNSSSSSKRLRVEKPSREELEGAEHHEGEEDGDTIATSKSMMQHTESSSFQHDIKTSALERTQQHTGEEKRGCVSEEGEQEGVVAVIDGMNDSCALGDCKEPEKEKEERLVSERHARRARVLRSLRFGATISNIVVLSLSIIAILITTYVTDADYRWLFFLSDDPRIIGSKPLLYTAFASLSAIPAWFACVYWGFYHYTINFYEKSRAAWEKQRANMQQARAGLLAERMAATASSAVLSSTAAAAAAAAPVHEPHSEVLMSGSSGVTMTHTDNAAAAVEVATVAAATSTAQSQLLSASHLFFDKRGSASFNPLCTPLSLVEHDAASIATFHSQPSRTSTPSTIAAPAAAAAVVVGPNTFRTDNTSTASDVFSAESTSRHSMKNFFFRPVAAFSTTSGDTVTSPYNTLNPHSSGWRRSVVVPDERKENVEAGSTSRSSFIAAAAAAAAAAMADNTAAATSADALLRASDLGAEQQRDWHASPAVTTARGSEQKHGRGKKKTPSGAMEDEKAEKMVVARWGEDGNEATLLRPSLVIDARRNRRGALMTYDDMEAKLAALHSGPPPGVFCCLYKSGASWRRHLNIFGVFALLRLVYFLLCGTIMVVLVVYVFTVVTNLMIAPPSLEQWNEHIALSNNNTKMCTKIQIEGKCSGWRRLCNATWYEDQEAANKDGCPYCPELQHIVATFTKTCEEQYVLLRKINVILYEVSLDVCAVFVMLAFVTTAASSCLGAWD